MNKNDPYYKKTLSYKLTNHNLEFMVSQELFSSYILDHGTQRLLRTLIFENISSFNKALDLGCGYGPIGICLKKINPQAEVHMVDKDALAIKYSLANAELNGVSDNIKVYGSLGYDEVLDTDFDLILSNIPAKVGEHVLHHIIKDAQFHLKENGVVAIVVIDAIADYIQSELISDESIEITYHHAWPGHHVYHYRFKSLPSKPVSNSAFNEGKYARQKTNFTFRGNQFTLQTTFHLPEFNQVSYDTSLVLNTLEKTNFQAQNILIFNPGQGYLPLAVAQVFNPDQLIMTDRDLQALTVSRENLISFGYTDKKISLFHQVGIDTGQKDLDLIVGILPEQQNITVYILYLNQARMQLREKGLLLLASSSTVITRIEEYLSKVPLFKTEKRVKDRGRSILTLSKI